MVGKYTVVTTNSALSQRGGYYCDVCECLLKDSTTYLDHINGKKRKTLCQHECLCTPFSPANPEQ